MSDPSRPYLKPTKDSWHVDETYFKVPGKWMYVYRAVDSTGRTLDFLLNETRSTREAKCFFRKALGLSNVTAVRAKDTYATAMCHRLAGRRGKKLAIVTVTHSMVASLYHILYSVAWSTIRRPRHRLF